MEYFENRTDFWLYTDIPDFIIYFSWFFNRVFNGLSTEKQIKC